MNRFSAPRYRRAGVFAALLILLQSVGFTGGASPGAYDDSVDQPAEIQLGSVVLMHAADVSPLLVLPVFSGYVTIQVVRPVTPFLPYQNCRAFLVNSFSFNAYYTHLSALAP